MFSHLLASRPSSWITLACTDKHYHNKHPSFLLLDLSRSGWSTSLCVEHPFCQVGSLDRQCSLPASCISSLRPFGWGWVAGDRGDRPLGFISHPGNQNFVSFLYPKSGNSKRLTEDTARMAGPNWPYSIPWDNLLIKKNSGQRREREGLAMVWKESKNITGVTKTKQQHSSTLKVAFLCFETLDFVTPLFVVLAGFLPVKRSFDKFH